MTTVNSPPLSWYVPFEPELIPIERSVVTVLEPAEWLNVAVPDSAMRSYLEYGKIDVYAPESARDFVVATKAMEVVEADSTLLIGGELGQGKRTPYDQYRSR